MRLLPISLSYRFDLGELDAFLHDIADLAFYLFEHARERGAQGLLGATAPRFVCQPPGPSLMM